MLAQAFSRITRTLPRPPTIRSMNDIRTSTTDVAHTLTPRTPKSLIIVPLLATVGTLLVFHEDVVTMGWKDVSIFEKTIGGVVVLKTFDRHLVAKKEDGKWKINWERNLRD